MQFGDVLRGQTRGCVDRCKLRGFLAVNGSDISSRISGRAVGFVEELGPKSGEHFLHVARHLDGDGGAGGVECDLHTEILVAFRTNGDFVIVEL